MAVPIILLTGLVPMLVLGNMYIPWEVCPCC